MKHFGTLLIFMGGLALLSGLATASPLAADCAPDFSRCDIPENVLLQLPFLGISGDVIL